MRTPMLLVSFAPVFVVACLSAACGGSDTEGTARNDSSKKAPPASKTDQNAAGETWNTIITGDWTLDPATEGYKCVRKTLEEDLIISAFDAVIPLGTHHTLLTVGDPTKPDGMVPCTAGDNYPLAIFGSGVGTNALEFPEGVGVRVAKGKQLNLNLHLFNTGTEPLSGTSGTRVRLMKADDVVDYAEGILAGTIALKLPAHEKTTSVGFCPMSHDVNIFAVSPHMHQLGTYMKVVAEPAGKDEVVLHDGPYDFNEQRYYEIDLLHLSKGDELRVECTHTNTTDKLVTFGDSSLAEMCFAGVYRYPAEDDGFACVADARL
jgi:hypothetical protein